MYIPKYFRNNNQQEIEAFIIKNSFAVLITHHQQKTFATHIPVELETLATGEKVLHGHISRGNPQWRSFENSDEVLVIFSGAHSYVSSSWYNHLNVPTWNYIAVHVSGHLRMLNEEELFASLKKLVDKYEVISKNPVTVEGMEDYMRNQIKGIVGFEMKIEKMEGKWKMSQNRDEEDYKNIIKELEQLDENAKAVAEEMKRIRG